MGIAPRSREQSFLSISRTQSQNSPEQEFWDAGQREGAWRFQWLYLRPLSQRREKSLPTQKREQTSSFMLTPPAPKLSLLRAFKVSKSDVNCFCHIMLFPHTHKRLPQSLRKKEKLRFLAPELPLYPITNTTEDSGTCDPTLTASLPHSTGAIWSHPSLQFIGHQI